MREKFDKYLYKNKANKKGLFYIKMNDLYVGLTNTGNISLSDSLQENSVAFEDDISAYNFLESKLKGSIDVSLLKVVTD